MKHILFLFILVVLIFAGCVESEVVSYNLSKAADQFEIPRRVVFYNGITDTYMLTVEGFCSITVDKLDNQLELTVKTGEGQFLKHYLGLSDNVSYFVEQLEAKNIPVNHYRVIFRPSVIIPNIDIR